MFSGVKVSVGACLMLAVVGSTSNASAGPMSLRDLMFGSGKAGASASPPVVSRYQPDRGEGFVLDRIDGHHAVLKFDDSPELWALTASPGPRGDVMYHDDMGEAVLRATKLGGLTLFTAGDPEGTAAALLGAASPPRTPPVLGPEALLQILIQASARASHAAQHLIIFDAVDAVATPTTEPVFADAFLLTADAIVRVSTHGPVGRAATAHVYKVHFIQGPDAAAAVLGQVVQITIAPDLGVAGRPSSRLIAAAIWRR